MSSARLGKHRAVFPPDFVDGLYRVLYRPALLSRPLRALFFGLPPSRVRMALVARFFWRVFENVSEGGPQRVTSMVSEDWTGDFAGIESFTGRSGIDDWWKAITASFPGLRLAVREFIDPGGEDIVAVLGVAGRGSQSGMTVEQVAGAQPFFFVLTIHDGMCVRIRAYTRKAEALAAVGLRE